MDLGEALTQEIFERSPGDRADPRPATLDRARAIIEAGQQPKFEVGDVVRLRPWAKHYNKWPKMGDECIVTHVMGAPLYGNQVGYSSFGTPHNINLAFIDADGDMVEFAYDSRQFEKVRSVYDPVTTDSGEILSVE